MLLALLLATMLLNPFSQPILAQSVESVTTNRPSQIGSSSMSVGVTHTQFSLNPWGDGPSVERGKQLLREGVHYQNQHIYGWGAVNPNLAPGVYQWNSLDRRVQLMRDTGATPIITLCCAPDWMTSLGTTTSNYPNKPPTAAHYNDFAQLVRLIAQRYPDVKHYVVWNEMKGLWNRGAGQWDFVSYTQLYNAAYDALKAVDPTIQVGGPYLVIDGSATERGPWFTWTPIVRRNLLVLDYWLHNAHGVDFIAIDRKVQGYQDNYNYSAAEKLALTPTYDAISSQLRERYGLPIWYIEQHFTGQRGGPLAFQAAGIASMLLHQVTGGTTLTVQWEPEQSHDVVAEHLFSSTQQPNGGQPYPNYFVYKLFHDYFGPGTSLFVATSTSPELEVLASAQVTLLINKRAAPMDLQLDGLPMTLAPYEIRLLTPSGATLQSITHPDTGVTGAEVQGPNAQPSPFPTDQQNLTFLPLINDGAAASTSEQEDPVPSPPVDPGDAEQTSPTLTLPGSIDATFWDRITPDQVAANPPAIEGVAAAAMASSLVWLQQFSAPDSSDRLTALAADSTGFYAAGSTYGDLESVNSHRGYQDSYIRRYDVGGNVLWTRQFGNNGDSGVSGVAIYEVDKTEWVYVVGAVDSPLPDQTGVGSWDSYLRKYEGDGSNLWTVQFGSSGDEFATDVAVDETGVYVTGNTDAALGTATNFGYQDAFLRKFDHNGNELWTRQFGTGDADYAEAIAVGKTSDGTIVYVAGGTAGALGGQPHIGHWDAFIQAYTADDGALLWTQQFGTPYDDRARDIAVAPESEAPGLYVTGYVEGALPGQSFQGIYDNYLRKYHADGSEIWTRQFGTPWNDQATAVAGNSSGIYVTGWTLGNFDTPNSVGNANITRHQFDLQGTLVDTQQLGGGGQDEGNAISASLAHIYIGGDTNGALPGQTFGGRIDAFTAQTLANDHILVADAFDRTRISGWREAEIGGLYTLRGAWSYYPTNNDTGHIDIVAAGTGRSATLQTVNGENLSILYAIMLDRLPSGGSIFTSVAARYRDDQTEYRGQIRFAPTGEVFLQAIRLGNGRAALGTETLVPDLLYRPDSKVWIRMEVVGSNPTTLRMKVWPALTDEPVAWHYSTTDSSTLLQGGGGVGLRVYVPATVQSIPIRVTFDDLFVVSLP